MSASETSRGGIGFAGLLTVLFIGLKLTGAISWSWWIVLALLWVPYVVRVILFVALCVAVGLRS